MKLCTLLLLCVLASLPGTAQPPAAKGADLVIAEITRASDESVTFRNDAGQLITLPLSQLSEADRDQVRNWQDRNIPVLRVTPHFTTSDHGTGTTPSHQVLDLAVDLQSESGTADLEANLKYILIGRDMEKEDRYKVLAIQAETFTVKGDESTALTFKTVKNYYQAGKGSSKGARCIGYVLHATRKGDDRPLFSLGSTPVLQKAVEAIVTLTVGEETGPDFIPLSGTHSGHSRDLTVK